MSIIRKHNITLNGGNKEYKIVLRPLSDEHLPYLYKWNADPEVLYWTEGGPEDVELSYPLELVEKIYGGISQDNLCFAVEVNENIVGECWLQAMNYSQVNSKVAEMYKNYSDVRRIDMCIGEKEYWGKGIGTLFIKMLVDFAFHCEHVDALHCFCEDYNIRSRRVWEKNGFKLVFIEELPQPQIGKYKYHWRLTKSEYMSKDYSKHAVVWDWDGFDNTPEYEYWCDYASKFGTKVFIPMCALGEVGAYMASHKFDVTAFDMTEEMILEGKKRFDSVDRLEFQVADICNFDFPCKIYDFAFIKDQDLHLLQTIEDVKKALSCVSEHLRIGGCLVLELTLPGEKSSYSPKQIFHPRKPHYVGKKVWKESECRYDAAEKRNYIKQQVYVEENGVTESFEYAICLQYYNRDIILHALGECGFIVTGEYSDRERTPWTEGKSFWCIEAIKSMIGSREVL